MKRFFIVLSIALGLSACNYDFIEPETANLDPNDTVSFKTDVAPIFSNNSKCTSCHSPGETAPDLTANNAYNSVMTDDIVVPGDGEGSTLYFYPAPQTSEHGWSKYSTEEAQLVLLWINQGALNN